MYTVDRKKIYWKSQEVDYRINFSYHPHPKCLGNKQ